MSDLAGFYNARRSEQPHSHAAPTNSQTWEDERFQLRQQVYDLERQLRSVKLYGIGYLLKHGKDRMQLNPLDVTVVLPAGQPTTELELRSRVAELEFVVSESDIDVIYRQRLLDDAKRQVAALERWRKAVLDLSAECADASDGNCSWSACVRDLLQHCAATRKPQPCAALNIQPTTLRTYKFRIRRKLGADTWDDAVRAFVAEAVLAS